MDEESTVVAEQTPTDPNPRPVAVTVIAVLQLIGGAAALAALAYGATRSGELTGPLHEMGVRPGYLLFFLLTLALPPLLAGVGMLRAKPWGWWLGSFWFLYRVALSLQTVIFAVPLLSGEPTDPGDPRLSISVLKYLFWALVAGAIYGYLLSPEVRRYFGVLNFPRRRYLLQHLAVVVVLFLIAAFFGLTAEG